MLIEKHEPVNLFALVPLERDPVLGEMDRLLDDDALFAEVKADLAQRRPHTRTLGRHSTPVEVILRMLVVKHFYNCSYEQTERFVADSITLRPFCRLYLQSVPDDTVLIRWANQLQPATLHRLLAHIVGIARQLKVPRGRKLRTDGPVVEVTGDLFCYIEAFYNRRRLHSSIGYMSPASYWQLYHQGSAIA
jgi:IS5 family transposase